MPKSKAKVGRLEDGCKTFRQIGKELGISGQQVINIYHRALGKMRRAIENDPSLADCLLEPYENVTKPGWRARKERVE